jgi:HSP20 family molecular chaperone IbpA
VGELARWEEGSEDLFEEFFRSFPIPLWPACRPLLETRGWAPVVEMDDQDNETVLKMELPGIERKDIHRAGTDDS